MVDPFFLCRPPPLPPPHKVVKLVDPWLRLAGAYSATLIASDLGECNYCGSIWLG